MLVHLDSHFGGVSFGAVGSLPNQVTRMLWFVLVGFHPFRFDTKTARAGMLQSSPKRCVNACWDGDNHDNDTEPALATEVSPGIDTGLKRSGGSTSTAY
jgi:hypothetical protein